MSALRSTVSERAGAAVLIAWAVAVASLIPFGYVEELHEVPNRLDHIIIWPFTMAEGALWGCLVLLVFRKEPGILKTASAVLAGSGAFILIKTASLEWSDYARFSSVVFAVPLMIMLSFRKQRSFPRFTVIATFCIFGSFAYFTHQGLLFPVFEAVDAQRENAVRETVNSGDPLSQAHCRAEGFKCFEFDPALDPGSFGLTESEWDAMKSVYSHHPVYEAQIFRFVDRHALNADTDYVLVGMRSSGASMAVAISSRQHLIQWRIIANRYMLTSLSIAFLSWFSLLMGVGLTHARMRARRLEGRVRNAAWREARRMAVTDGNRTELQTRQH